MLAVSSDALAARIRLDPPSVCHPFETLVACALVWVPCTSLPCFAHPVVVVYFVLCFACQVCDALELSRKTLSKIQQNLGWAFCYNLVGIPLAAGALLPKYGIALTPSISGALMGFSSLAVMANSLVLQWEVQGLRNGLVTAQQHDAAGASVSAVSRASGWQPAAAGSSSSKVVGGSGGSAVAAVATGVDVV